MFIIDDIFLAPLKGFVFVVSKIAEELDREYFDRDKIQQEMLKLRLLYEMDEIDEKEYEQRETNLLNRLSKISEEEEEEEEEEGEEDE